MLRLPEVPVGSRSLGLYRTMTKAKGTFSENEKLIERFGEMMVDMLPEDLAFTLFVPSQKAFERDSRLRLNDSLVGEKLDDTYAVVFRILGFSAIPRTLSSVALPYGRQVAYDSISGFTLYISKDRDGTLFVNRIRSERVDLKKGVRDGVIMDAQFEQSIPADDSEE